MGKVLPIHDPPIERVTLKGHFEDVFDVQDRIRNRCKKFVAGEVLYDTDDDDEVEVTIVLFPGHNLTKEMVERFVQDNDATGINIEYNNGGNHVGNDNT